MESPGTKRWLSPAQRVTEVLEHWRDVDKSNPQVLHKRLVKVVKAAERWAALEAEENMVELHDRGFEIGS